MICSGSQGLISAIQTNYQASFGEYSWDERLKNLWAILEPDSGQSDPWACRKWGKLSLRSGTPHHDEFPWFFSFPGAPQDWILYLMSTHNGGLDRIYLSPENLSVLGRMSSGTQNRDCPKKWMYESTTNSDDPLTSVNKYFHKYIKYVGSGGSWEVSQLQSPIQMKAKIYTQKD